MAEIKNILIRLPNWLGDMVMATAFAKAVQDYYPHASIDFIAKNGIDFLLDYYPIKGHCYVFSKIKYAGLAGAIKFGKQIKSRKKYDLFFCLPNSLSAAAMAKSIGATISIGFKKSMHSIFFTKTFTKKTNAHRVDEYIDLLEQYTKKPVANIAVTLANTETQKDNALVININSEASSRRLPATKAISIIENIRSQIPNEIILVGSPTEEKFVTSVYNLLPNKTNIKNIAGSTTLPELIKVFANCKAVLTTDSGPAHVSNALGKKTIVLFGAGNEYNTAPYNKATCTVIRLGKLPCEPCVKNECKLYTVPECLLQLDETIITNTVIKNLV